MSSKNLAVRPVPSKGSVYEIHYEGGGQVPDILKGLYTSTKKALLAISMYTPPRTSKKDTKNGSKNS